MHLDELDIDGALVRRLLGEQFPEWFELPLRRVEPKGTVNAIFRLGDELSVRLARRGGPTEPGGKGVDWLPRLAPLLPVAVPIPVAQGRPTDVYPWFWEVHTWVESKTVPVDEIDAIQAARDLAALVATLQSVSPAGAPPGRGVPLTERDSEVRYWLARFDGDPAVTKEWGASGRSPAVGGPARLAPRRARCPQLGRARRAHQRRHRLGIDGCRRPSVRCDGRVEAPFCRGA